MCRVLASSASCTTRRARAGHRGGPAACHWISVGTFCPALFLICAQGCLKRSFVLLDEPDGMTMSGVNVDRPIFYSQSRKRLCQLKWTRLYFWVFSLEPNNNLLLIISCIVKVSMPIKLKEFLQTFSLSVLAGINMFMFLMLMRKRHTQVYK